MTVNETLRRIHRWPRHKRIAFLKLSLALATSTIRKAEFYDALKSEMNDQLLTEIAEDHAA